MKPRWLCGVRAKAQVRQPVPCGQAGGVLRRAVGLVELLTVPGGHEPGQPIPGAGRHPGRCRARALTGTPARLRSARLRAGRFRPGRLRGGSARLRAGRLRGGQAGRAVVTQRRRVWQVRNRVEFRFNV